MSGYFWVLFSLLRLRSIHHASVLSPLADVVVRKYSCEADSDDAEMKVSG